MIRSEGLQNLMGINFRNLRLVYAHNPRRFFPQADDKIIAKELLAAAGVPVPKTIGVIDSFATLEGIWEELRQHQDLVIKPAKGKAGGGILVLSKDREGRFCRPSGRPIEDDEILRHFGDILFGVYSFGRPDDRVLLEELIIPHGFLTGIYPFGVADIRVILLESRPLMAMLRVPTAGSEGKANLHQGAVGIGLSLSDGRLGDGIWRGKAVQRHPDSEVLLHELILPQWPAMLKIAVAASRQVELGYLGVDLVLDERHGPLVLEINARPGLEIQLANMQGLLKAAGDPA
jgi:alpha-L-glutamate ligase-like protein